MQGLHLSSRPVGLLLEEPGAPGSAWPGLHRGLVLVLWCRVQPRVKEIACITDLHHRFWDWPLRQHHTFCASAVPGLPSMHADSLNVTALPHLPALALSGALGMDFAQTCPPSLGFLGTYRVNDATCGWVSVGIHVAGGFGMYREHRLVPAIYEIWSYIENVSLLGLRILQNTKSLGIIHTHTRILHGVQSRRESSKVLKTPARILQPFRQPSQTRVRA